MNFDEMYIVHNGIMAIAHEELLDAGFVKQAQTMQELANSEDGAIILHQLIKTTIDLIELNRETEIPKQQ